MHNLPRGPKSLQQGLAWCNILCAEHQWRQREKPKNDKETQLKPKCQNTHEIRANKKDWHKRQHQTRRCTVSNRICNPNRRNRQRAETEESRIQNKIKSQTGLTTMDGRRMPHPPWLKQTTWNIRHHQPCGKQIPYPIWSSRMQSH